MTQTSWEPPYTFEERLKYALVPPRLYRRRLAAKQLRKGERELGLLPFLVDAAKASVDVGANKGVYTHYLAQLTPAVHAFEPNPKIFRILDRALPDNVTAYQVALSNTAGSAELAVPARKGGYSNQRASLSTASLQAPHKAVEVHTQTLDHYDLRDVGFIKIDVEGHEQAVLDGARATLSRERPVLMIELEEVHTGVPIEQSIRDIEALHYDAMFLARGQLRPIRHFDSAAHHNAGARDDYVYNFIFLPTSAG